MEDDLEEGLGEEERQLGAEVRLGKGEMEAHFGSNFFARYCSTQDEHAGLERLSGARGDSVADVHCR